MLVKGGHCRVRFIYMTTSLGSRGVVAMKDNYAKPVINQNHAKYLMRLFKNCHTFLSLCKEYHCYALYNISRWVNHWTAWYGQDEISYNLTFRLVSGGYHICNNAWDRVSCIYSGYVQCTIRIVHISRLPVLHCAVLPFQILNDSWLAHRKP